MKRNAFLAIAVGGGIAGTLDLLQACILFGWDIPLVIAGGLLGQISLLAAATWRMLRSAPLEVLSLQVLRSEMAHNAWDGVGALRETDQLRLRMGSWKPRKHLQQFPGILRICTVQRGKKRRDEDIRVVDLVQLVHYDVALVAFGRFQLLDQFVGSGLLF